MGSCRCYVAPGFSVTERDGGHADSPGLRQLWTVTMSCIVIVMVAEEEGLVDDDAQIECQHLPTFNWDNMITKLDYPLITLHKTLTLIKGWGFCEVRKS